MSRCQDSTPMILFVGDVARGDRDREGFQEVDFAADVRARSPNGRRGSTTPRASPNMSPAPMRRAIVGAAGAGGAGAARGHAARRGRGGRPARRSRRRVQPGPRDGDDALTDLLQGRRARRSRSSAAPAGARRGASFRASSPSGSGFRSRSPSAARTRSRTLPGLCRQSRLSAPIRSWSQRIQEADLLLVVGAAARRGDDRRLHADHPRSSRPDAGPRPSRPERARPRLPHRLADLRRHARVRRAGGELGGRTSSPSPTGAEAHAEWLRLVDARSRASATLDLGQMRRGDARARCRRTRSSATAPAISRAGGTASGITAPAPRQLAPTNGAMGYGVPAAVAAALRAPERQVVASPATAIS